MTMDLNFIHLFCASFPTLLLRFWHLLGSASPLLHCSVLFSVAGAGKV